MGRGAVTLLLFFFFPQVLVLEGDRSEGAPVLGGAALLSVTNLFNLEYGCSGRTRENCFCFSCRNPLA